MTALPADLDAALFGGGRGVRCWSPATTTASWRLWWVTRRPRSPSPVWPRRCPPAANVPGVTVALVSGRGVADLQATSGLTGPFRWVGSHGEEFDGPLAGELAERRDALVELLAPAVAAVPGARLEIKPASVAVHVRRSGTARRPPRCWPTRGTLGRFVTDTEAGQGGPRDHADRRGQGHRPAATDRRARCDRGHVPRGRRHRRGRLRALRSGDLTVKIGEGPTDARYRVADPAGALAVLRRLGDLLA